MITRFRLEADGTSIENVRAQLNQSVEKILTAISGGVHPGRWQRTVEVITPSKADALRFVGRVVMLKKES